MPFFILNKNISLLWLMLNLYAKTFASFFFVCKTLKKRSHTAEDDEANPPLTSIAGWFLSFLVDTLSSGCHSQSSSLSSAIANTGFCLCFITKYNIRLNRCLNYSLILDNLFHFSGAFWLNRVLANFIRCQLRLWDVRSENLQPMQKHFLLGNSYRRFSFEAPLSL